MYKFNFAIYCCTFLIASLTLTTGCSPNYQAEFNEALEIVTRSDEVKRVQWDNLILKLNDAVANGYPLSQNIKSEEELVEYLQRHYPELKNIPGVKDVNLKTISIYLDNSHSMAGYFPRGGNMDFSATIIDLYNAGSDSTEIAAYLAGKNIESIDPIKFRKELSDGTIAIAASSPLAEIFDSIIYRTASDEISCFITDAIMSGTNQDIRSNREYNYVNRAELRQTIRETFSQARKKSYDILAYRFETPFKGVYYDYKNGRYNLNLTQRPYFIFMIGDGRLLDIAKENLTKELSFRPENYLYTKYQPITVTKYRIQSPSQQEYIADHVRGEMEFANIPTKDAQIGLRLELASLPEHMQNMGYIKRNLVVTTLDHSTKQEIVCSDYLTKIEVLNEQTKEYLLTLHFPIDYLNRIPNEIKIKMKSSPTAWYLDYASEKDDGANFEETKTFALDYMLEGMLMGMEAMELPDAIDVKLKLAIK